MASSDYKIAIKIAGQLDSSFTKAMNSANSQLQTVANVGAKSVKVAAAALVAAGTAIAGVVASSINVGKDFEAQMSSTAATANATAEEYALMQEAAMEMGRTTSKTATEAAAALEYMALAGWSVEDSCASLEAVLRLSEATELDLATASDLVTDSMSAMGVSVDQLSQYLDVCASANNNSNQTAEQLMEAMIGCGGAARTAGMDFTETATALGILANNGIKGTEAGTALNSMLVRISTNTAAASAFEELGVAVYDSSGNMRGLQDILVDTSKALDGMADSEKNAYLKAIAGTNYYSDFQYLLNGVSDATDDAASSWDTLTESLTNCEGALESMASTKLDNLSGDLSVFNSALEDVQLRIYSPCRHLCGMRSSSERRRSISSPTRWKRAASPGWWKSSEKFWLTA